MSSSNSSEVPNQTPEKKRRYLSAEKKFQIYLEAQAGGKLKGYFTWYDTEHYHSGIDYVTPQQAHDGQRQTIVEQRRTNKLAQRRRRREENQKQKTGQQETNKHITMPASLVA